MMGHEFRNHRRQLPGYLVAVGATAAAALVMHVLQPFVAPSVALPFILAVTIAALYGGVGPALLAVLLGTAALSYWFLPPFRLETPADLAPELMFLVVATIIAWVAGSVHRQRWTAVRQARENERLRRAAEEISRQAQEEAVKAEEAAAEAEMAMQEAAEALERQLEAEKALRRSEAELADFFDNAPVALHWVGEDGTILRANQAELDLLGYQRSEYVGRHIAEFHVDRAVIDGFLDRLVAGQVVRSQPARLRCKDGGIKDVLIDSSAYRVDGRFRHSRSFTRDVTAEKRAQEAVARLAAIVSSSSDAIIGKTLDGTITSWNAAAERIFGYSAAEIVGQSIFRLIPEELHEAERSVLKRLRQGQRVEFAESERLRKDGRRVWISLSVSPVRDGSGAIIGAASIKRDITERKVTEERLRETQRLQAVGQLAGGIAHETNNQMSVVLGGAQFLLRSQDLTPTDRADVEVIRQAAERTASITHQLLAFSRRQVLQLKDVDLNRVVESLEPVLRRSLTERHELVVRLGLHDVLVRADPHQLEQVLLNLTLNARDAMGDGGGRVGIETREVTLTGQAGETGEPPPGRYAVLIVEDTGHGMKPETLRRAFEPFFTTKEMGAGTGLGLSVVHGIVNQTGGHIRVESEPGKGARFRLYFPITSPGPRAEPATAPAAVPSDHGRVALLVEDDAQVRSMAARGLAEAGYDVLEAGSGRAALELVGSHTGRLDIVVTDLGMPDMDGYELGRRLREERPGLPILYVSGYGDAEGAGPILRKPFAPDVLVREVGELLRQSVER